MYTLAIVLGSVAVGFLLAMVVVRLTRSSSIQAPSIDVTRVPVSEQVVEYVARGEKIRAIKQLREETSLSLKDAKDVVDHVVRQYQAALGR